MPLIGLIDETGDHVTWEDIEEGNGVFSDPLPMLLAFRDRVPYVDFSTTELIQDPYQLQMRRRFDYFESPDDIMDRFMGSNIHSSLENIEHEGCMIEKEFKYQCTDPTIKGKRITIGGRADLIINNQLWDYKTVTMSKLKYIAMGKANDSLEHWAQQLNMLHYFAYRAKGIPEDQKIEEMFIRVICRDWRFYEFRKGGYNTRTYPRGAVVPIAVWGIKKTEEFVKERIELHCRARNLSDEKLHNIGECDTWRGLRCDHYCAIKKLCWFRRNDTATVKEYEEKQITAKPASTKEPASKPAKKAAIKKPVASKVAKKPVKKIARKK